MNDLGEQPTCPICGQAITGADAVTKMLERFTDGVGEVGDPRRPLASPAREMVPGDQTITYSPCGHSEVVRMTTPTKASAPIVGKDDEGETIGKDRP